MHPAAAGHLVPFPAGTGSGGWWRPRCLARSASSPAAAWPRCGTGRCYRRLAPGRHSPVEGLGAKGYRQASQVPSPAGVQVHSLALQPWLGNACHHAACAAMVRRSVPPGGGLQCPIGIGAPKGWLCHGVGVGSRARTGVLCCCFSTSEEEGLSLRPNPSHCAGA